MQTPLEIFDSEIFSKTFVDKISNGANSTNMLEPLEYLRSNPTSVVVLNDCQTISRETPRAEREECPQRLYVEPPS